jgi:hypothetical protein
MVIGLITDRWFFGEKYFFEKKENKIRNRTTFVGDAKCT